MFKTRLKLLLISLCDFIIHSSDVKCGLNCRRFDYAFDSEQTHLKGRLNLCNPIYLFLKISLNIMGLDVDLKLINKFSKCI